jgi:hypothetical protein
VEEVETDVESGVQDAEEWLMTRLAM